RRAGELWMGVEQAGQKGAPRSGHADQEDGRACGFSRHVRRNPTSPPKRLDHAGVLAVGRAVLVSALAVQAMGPRRQRSGPALWEDRTASSIRCLTSCCSNASLAEPPET